MTKTSASLTGDSHTPRDTTSDFMEYGDLRQSRRDILNVIFTYKNHKSAMYLVSNREVQAKLLISRHQIITFYIFLLILRGEGMLTGMLTM